MTLPWIRLRRPRAGDARLMFSLTPDGLDWLRSEPGPDGATVTHGHVPRPADDADWWPELRRLGAGVAQAHGVLRLPQYQLLQIEAPAVPQEELKAAARWRIKDLLDVHVDQVTLDVLRLGDPRRNGRGHDALFVVAAPNEEVAALTGLCAQAGWPLQVIEVADTAQRNLQSAHATRLDLGERATACLVRHGPLALLTICAGGELYYSRRLEWDDPVRTRAARPAAATAGPQELVADAAQDIFAMAALATELAADDTPRLVIELQRSFDVWERSWPDLPLAALFVGADSADDTLSDYLQDQLAMRVLPLLIEPAGPPELAGALLRPPESEA